MPAASLATFLLLRNAPHHTLVPSVLLANLATTAAELATSLVTAPLSRLVQTLPRSTLPRWTSTPFLLLLLLLPPPPVLPLLLPPLLPPPPLLLLLLLLPLRVQAPWPTSGAGESGENHSRSLPRCDVPLANTFQCRRSLDIR